MSAERPSPTERVRSLAPNEVWDNAEARRLSAPVLKRVPDPLRRLFEKSRYTGFFQRMIVNHSVRQSEMYDFKGEQRKKSYAFVYGEEFKDKPRLTLSTSTVCVRRAQYYELDFETPPPTFRQAMAMLEGSALHKVYQDAAWQLPQEDMATETYIPPSFLLEETDVLRGKPDMVKRIPETKSEWQVIDYKNIAPFVFNKLLRQDVPEHIRKDTKDYYNPFPADRLQTLLYMYILRTKFNLDVTLGKVLYVNKADYSTKEALVIWDDHAEFQVDKFKEEVMKATKGLEKAKKALGDGMDNVELGRSDILNRRTARELWVCASCPFLKYCPPGMDFASKEIAEGKRSPLPKYIRDAIKGRIAEEKLKLLELGIEQTLLLSPEELIILEKAKKK
ncbi:MAG TPA: PD-(D/E)XK nuclease family protein [Patescibacteria group bacterium]|nr:PD-(D/E)XK nuclease family protein [Patescibacteria group bacterium]